MCGMIGVSKIPDAARLAYLGLYALQHRGQESAGIVAVDREGQARGAPRHGPGVRELPRAGPEAPDRRRRGGPHPLLHRRQHRARQRAALLREHPLRRPVGGAQRQPHQRRRAAARAGGRRARSSRRRPTPSAWSTSSRAPARRPWKARSARRWAARKAPTAWSSAVGRDALRRRRPRGFRPLMLGRLGERHHRRLRDLRASTSWAPPSSASCSRASSCASWTARSRRSAAPAPQAGQPLRLRAGLLLPPRQHHLRPLGGRGAPRDRPPAGRRAPGARRARWCSRCPTAPTRWRSASARCRAPSSSTA